MMETFAWILGIGSICLGGLSVALAIILTNMTNKTIKSEDARAKELIERMDKSTKEMLERMDKRSEGAQKILDRMEANSEDTQKILARMERDTKELIERMDKSTKEMLERMSKENRILLSHISDLIAAEGEKTRELIKMK